MPSFVYNTAKQYIIDGTIDLEGDTFKLILLGTGHTPSMAHSALADIALDEISGDGYTAGGVVVPSTAITRVGAVVRFDGTDVEFTGLSPSFRYAALYDDSHPSDALLALLDPGALQSPNGANAQIIFDANGIFTLTDG